jgi:hypothetical protein
MTCEEEWNIKFEKVKLYIDKYDKLPKNSDKNNDIKTLANWINTQKVNYKLKKNIMSNNIIYKQWKDFVNSLEYKKYFMNDIEIWFDNLKNVKKYIDEHKKRPSITDKDNKIKSLGVWLILQIQSYKNKNTNRIIKNKELYETWKDFINDEKYKIYLIFKEELWFNSFNKVKNYINENKKRPTKHNKDPNIVILAEWIHHQITNYKNKKMLNNDIYNIWKEFINNQTYMIYFISNEELWIITLNDVKKYIDINKKRPSGKNNDQNIKHLGKWLQHQITYYKQKKGIMLNNDIYTKWIEFINNPKYKHLF